ncbi:MAG: hypothetical protein ABI560_16945, partial [Myxococcales bacterium]
DHSPTTVAAAMPTTRGCFRCVIMQSAFFVGYGAPAALLRANTRSRAEGVIKHTNTDSHKSVRHDCAG